MGRIMNSQLCNYSRCYNCVLIAVTQLLYIYIYHIYHIYVYIMATSRYICCGHYIYIII